MQVIFLHFYHFYIDKKEGNWYILNAIEDGKGIKESAAMEPTITFVTIAL